MRGDPADTLSAANPACQCGREMIAEAGLHTAERSSAGGRCWLDHRTRRSPLGGAHGGDYAARRAAPSTRGDGSMLLDGDGQFLHRPGGQAGPSSGIAAVEDKESLPLVQGADQAATVVRGRRAGHAVADRESDIVRGVSLCPEGADLLVQQRAQDRSLARWAAEAALDALPEAARAELDLPAEQRPRRARTTQVALRFATTLAQPKGGAKGGAKGGGQRRGQRRGHRAALASR